MPLFAMAYHEKYVMFCVGRKCIDWARFKEFLYSCHNCLLQKFQSHLLPSDMNVQEGMSQAGLYRPHCGIVWLHAPQGCACLVSPAGC